MYVLGSTQVSVEGVLWKSGLNKGIQTKKLFLYSDIYEIGNRFVKKSVSTCLLYKKHCHSQSVMEKKYSKKQGESEPADKFCVLDESL